MSITSSCIYSGFVTHRRFKPKKHFFSYASDFRQRFAEAYLNQNQSWINSILNDTVPFGSSAWDAMISTKIAEAGVKSFKQEKSAIIELQETPDFYKNK